MRRLGLVHTVSQLSPVFQELTAELLPGTEILVITDELLLKRSVRDGAIDDITRGRLEAHVAALADFGVDAVLVTCSSVGDVVDDIATRAEVPVLRVDRPMAELAVRSSSRIGVLATLPTTLAPTTALVESAAREAGRSVEVVPVLCVGAFEALSRGEPSRHDEIVGEALDRLAADVDVIVLAQASMARIAQTRPTLVARVLSSPRLAVQRLAEGGAERSASTARPRADAS